MKQGAGGEPVALMGQLDWSGAGRAPELRQTGPCLLAPLPACPCRCSAGTGPLEADEALLAAEGPELPANQRHALLYRMGQARLLLPLFAAFSVSCHVHCLCTPPALTARPAPVETAGAAVPGACQRIAAVRDGAHGTAAGPGPGAKGRQVRQAEQTAALADGIVNALHATTEGEQTGTGEKTGVCK